MPNTTLKKNLLEKLKKSFPSPTKTGKKKKRAVQLAL